MPTANNLILDEPQQPFPAYLPIRMALEILFDQDALTLLPVFGLLGENEFDKVGLCSHEVASRNQGFVS
jgi:hypothetical protein